MHASTEQLLSLRDGEPIDAEMAGHSAACSACSLELDRLRQIGHELRSLPARQVPPAAWQRIQARVQGQSPEREAQRQRRLMSFAAVAACVVLAAVAGVRMLNGSGHHSDTAAVPYPNSDVVYYNTAPAPLLHKSATPSATVATTPATSLDQLVAQSRQLDELLQDLPQPRVERVSLAATADTLEQRIQWLDFRLSFEPEAELSQEQTRQLWRERVDLMDSLVKVRYAQVQDQYF